MTKDLLMLGSYLTRRIRQESQIQQKYREDPFEDTYWGYKGQRYGMPFRRSEGLESHVTRVLTPVERLMRDRIRFLLTRQEQVVVMDYGAAAAGSLKRLSKLFKEDKRVVFFATSLSQTPTDLFLDGLSSENPEIHYIPGDIKDVLQDQTQIMKDGREVSLTHGVDVFVSDNAISHSRVPGIVFSQLPIILNDSSLAIIGNRWFNPLWDRGNLDIGAVGRARRREWDYGMENLQKQGYRLLTEPADSFNFLVFAGQQVGAIHIPQK